MMTAVGGYFNGTHIVPDEELGLHKGQRVVITALDFHDEEDERLEREMFLTDLERRLAHSEQQAANGQVTDAEEFFKEMRERYGYDV